MLGNATFVGFLPIGDAIRSRDFYCGRLGLPLVEEDGFAVVVDAGGTRLRLTVVSEVPEPVGTSAGWTVDDVPAAVRRLAAAGIDFERFDGMDQDDDGVWRSPGGSAIAWFRDPDGNRLSLTQEA